jgi:hypothetical protein
MNLSGCLALIDLAGQSSPLMSNEIGIAKKMALLTVQRCQKSQSINSQNSINTKIIQLRPAIITRLWSGDGWYRAESRAEGIVDYVYLNESSGQFICGSKNWDNTTQARLVSFVDLVATGKNNNSTLSSSKQDDGVIEKMGSSTLCMYIDPSVKYNSEKNLAPSDTDRLLARKELNRRSFVCDFEVEKKIVENPPLNFSRMNTVTVCDYLRSTWISDGDRQLALAEMQRRSNESCAPNLNRAGVQNASPAQPTAARQAEVARSTLNLTASASSPDSNGVVTLSITTNSDTASLRVNGDEVGSRADGRYSVQRFAQIGNNNFEVIATDRFGNTQRKTISVSRQAADNTVRFASLNPIAVRARPATNAVAIIIGIQDYSRVPKAEFASNDARVFYDYAIRGLGVRPENIKILLDQEASDIGILSAFKNWLPLKTRKGLTDVYVFYSGHGLPSDDGSNLYMLPHGVDRQFLDRTAIKQSELIASLQAVSPRSVTMFMDACYSGQIRTGETLLASARPISIQSKASSYPANFNVISASAPDQLASSSPDLKHGVFSYFLMKGMEGEADENKDGNITMAEMQSYLKEYVGKKAMSLNRTQVPQLSGDQSRVLVSR